MKIKEYISNTLEEMSINELALLYEQMELLQNKRKQQKKLIESYQKITLEQVHKLTSSSKNDWSEDVLKDRMERI